MNLKHIPKRINVVGTSGTGKSTFSRQLAALLQLPYIEMDALFWKPNWQQPTNDEFFERLSNSLNQPTWVLDGNYSRAQPLKWQQVDTVIWLNYSWHRNIYQLLTRTIKRSFIKQELWAGNRESFRMSFLSKDSIILWMLQNYHRQQREYLAMMNDPQYKYIQFIRVQNPKQAQQLLQQLQTLSSYS